MELSLRNFASAFTFGKKVYLLPKPKIVLTSDDGKFDKNLNFLQRELTEGGKIVTLLSYNWLEENNLSSAPQYVLALFEKCTPLEKNERNSVKPPSKEKPLPWPSFLNSGHTKEEYLKIVERAKELIRDGEVYQVNLGSKFLLERVQYEYLLAKLSESLLGEEEVSFFPFCFRNDQRLFISFSPETFFTLNGKENRISTFPIKGTRPRGETFAEDQSLSTELAINVKEGAELSMIVDLMRNDLNQICKTVAVDYHRKVITLPTLHHLVSCISGELEEGVSLSLVLRKLFPASSITGAPKLAAIKIIKELENFDRHFWTGAFGLISKESGNFHGDFKVSIRTGEWRNDTLTFAAGSGITLQSDAESEYEETLLKTKIWRSLL
jgi:anthranilate/para-aminobenzoate synthase component I